MTSLPETSTAPIVRVRGAATLEFPADHAVLYVAVARTSAAGRADALEQASTAASALRAAVDGAPGVRDVALSRVGVRDATRWQEQKREYERVGWEAHLSGRITVDAAAAGEVAGLVAVGGGTVAGITWGLDDLPAARRKTRIAAVAAAREMADDFAAAAGRDLGELRVLADPGLSGGTLRAEAFGAAPRAAAGAPSAAPQVDLDPEPVEVRAEVEATYLLA